MGQNAQRYEEPQASNKNIIIAFYTTKDMEIQKTHNLDNNAQGHKRLQGHPKAM